MQEPYLTQDTGAQINKSPTHSPISETLQISTSCSAGQNDYALVGRAPLRVCGYDEENSLMIETTIAGSIR